MLSATEKMEMRVAFANRMHDLIGPEFYNEDCEWLDIIRDFMAGKVVVVRRKMHGDEWITVDVEIRK